MVQLLSLFAPDACGAGARAAQRLILGLAAALAVAGECAAGSISVATWNVENYLTARRRVDGEFRPDYPKPEGEKDALRAVLIEANADVVALQEMGDEAHLAEFMRDLARDGLVYPHSAWVAGRDEERHVAVLSRVPFVRVERHEQVEIRYMGGVEHVRRGVLEVAVAAAGEELTLFVIHLKSRHTDRPDDPASATRRAAEAVAVRDLVLARFPDPSTARFLIAGDFNDSRQNRPLRAITRRGNTEIARILTASDDRGDMWTHHYRGGDSYTRVDFILASPGLISSGLDLDSRVIDSPHVRKASDHRPVVLTLEWSEGK